MRLRLVIVSVFLLAAPAVFAQPRDTVSIFVSQATFGWSSNHGTQLSGAVAAAFDRMLTPRVSAQLWIGTERHRTYSYVVEPNGAFRDVPPARFRTYPVDVAVRYHFLNETRWKPYIGAGARYVHAPGVSSDFRYSNHVGPEIVGGTALNITRSLAVVADAKIYFGEREQYDDQFKSAIGLSWRF